MNDLERDLHELLDAKARDASPPAPADVHVLRRARRRQVGTVATALVVLAAIVVGSVIALDAFRAVDEAPPRPASTPVLPDAPPGFESAALPYASIAYPEDWYLLDTSPLVPLGVAEPELLSGPVLQLANFDPDLPHAPRCMVDPDALPPQGVLLTVGIMTPEEAAIAGEPSGPWPVKLAPLPSSSDPVCTGGPRPYVATWTTQSGVIYWANAAQGSDAADADVEAMERAFASLAFPSTTEPQMSRMAAFQGQGTPRVVLGTERIGNGIATLVAYVEFNKSLLVGVSGSRGGDCCIGSAIAPHSGSSQQPVTTTILLSPQGTLVYGAITAEVAEAELRTSNGDAVPVRIAALPPSMGFEDRVAWGVAPGSDDRATMVGFDAEGNLIGNPILPAGPRVTIATGDDPEGGPWELYLEPTSDGTGLEFEFTNHGGGSGCCLRPLKSDFQLDGWGSGGDAPSNITVLASDVVAQVAFEAADGTTVDGALYPVPDDALEIPQVGLVIVPKEVPPEGEVVGYDADGNEVGREFVGESGEPSGPTPEIDAVWQALRAARDATTWYFERNGTFEPLDDAGAGLDALIELASAPVTFATRPEPEAVSLYVSDDRHLAVSSTTITGEAYCIGVEAPRSPNSSFNYRYGRVFAESYSDCTGGWSGE